MNVILKQLHWEDFSSALNSPFNQVIDPGPLLGSIKSFSIRRGKHHSLVLETISDASHRSARPTWPEAGTVRPNDDQVVIEKLKHRVLLMGVTSHSWSTKLGADGLGETSEKSEVHRIECAPSDPAQVHQTMEWVANLNDDLLFPQSMKEETTEKFTRTFSDVGEAFSQHVSIESGSGRRCLPLRVGGVALIIGSCEGPGDESVVRPRFILYEGYPTSEIREKIRDCLSFMLGAPLLYFGASFLSESGGLLGFNAKTVHSARGAMFDVPPLPPAPVSLTHTSLISVPVVTRTINSLFDSYDQLNLLSTFWSYWYAACAPIHMAAVHYGAMIEALQEAVSSRDGAIRDHRILKGVQLKAFSSEFNRMVEALDATSHQKTQLLAKASILNSSSLKSRSQQFFEEQGLAMGQIETAAWNRRNQAAHGNKIPREEFSQMIRDVKALKNILDRIILKSSGASEHYFDRYSLGHPLRPVTAPIE